MDRRQFLKNSGFAAAALAAGPPPLEGAAGGRRVAAASSPADVVVIGAGAWGGWTALHLSRMGARVTLVDAWGPGNSRSTSGDETRGFRSSYGDRPHGEQWVRWARQALVRWREWDEEFGTARHRPLFTVTGDLILRAEWEPFVTTTRQWWEKNHVPFEVLAADEVRYRWPQIRIPDITAVLYEPDAGVGRARLACQAVADAFQRAGGKLVIGKALPGARTATRLDELLLFPGEPLRADAYVFACGAWLPKLFPDVLGNRIRTPMGHVYYFGTPPGDSRFTAPNLPSFNVSGTTGWPALGHDARGFRVRSGGRPPQDPDASDRSIDPSEHARARAFLAERFPALERMPILETWACHYDGTVGRNFIIDRHPEMTNVWIAGGTNAEGFKFGPVVGEYVAGRVLRDEGDPALAAAFRIPEATFDAQPPAITQVPTSRSS